MIEPDNQKLTISDQCELLDLARSSFYYQSVRNDSNDIQLMRFIDEQYTKTPFYGVRRFAYCLRKAGFTVGPKRIRRLMKLMGIEAIYPKPRLSVPSPDHRKYPYLLRDVEITRPNQVWCTDITYIRMRQGHVYLVVIMDWFSRFVLSWKLSVTMDTQFCVEALEEALEMYQQPVIFNSDQGSQFTSFAFTDVLKAAEIRISMDGRGRVFDNIFIERLWRTVKYEEVYLRDYPTVPLARSSLGAYFSFYNDERPHLTFGYRTPGSVFFGTTDVKQQDLLAPKGQR